MPEELEVANWTIDNIINSDTGEYLERKHYLKHPPALSIKLPFNESNLELMLEGEEIDVSLLLSKSTVAILAPIMQDLDNIYKNKKQEESKPPKNLTHFKDKAVNYWREHKIMGSFYALVNVGIIFLLISAVINFMNI